jgi:hypothetical protein
MRAPAKEKEVGKVFDSVFLAPKCRKVHTAGEGKSPIHKKEKIIYRG